MASETQTCAIGILANRPNAQESDSPRTAPMEKTTKSLTFFMQNKPNFQKAKMNVNSFITKDYRKNDAFSVQKNKPNSNPNKANFKRDDGSSAYYTRDCHGTHKINRAVEGKGSEKGPAEKVNARAQKSFREENGIDGPAVFGYPVVLDCDIKGRETQSGVVERHRGSKRLN